MVLQLVERFRKKYTVTAILSALGIPRSSYYRWLARGISSILTPEEETIISSYARRPDTVMDTGKLEIA
ncbi:helix-turn-helix domain-containing protein [Fictibacillus terranigra]|uniref:Helix-turn-helix domain-containing protein n=1 Tax=Fictibacillus terranigra TaxID=3058424 RepID=A0ABT8E7K4_9BACL|nr:helix-turn-helix domain-containing protein [Fictibacillus sp. CENA-BCM004]MDN4073903.1 helix-turn-helix domain-containing protein [Fictibacillus sp. CENA-BCM004]